jgi:K+/H+ antiporter YhaU regulatory subunit KhtT
VVDTLRRVAPGLPVMMRAHYLSERDGLLSLGAVDVVAEEVEGAVEVIARLLRFVELPRNLIEQQIREVRSATQTSERKQTLPRSRLGELRGLDELKVELTQVHPFSRVVGASPISLKLRNLTGALVVGLRRNDQLLENPDPNTHFAPGDIVYFVGTGEALKKTLPLFDAPKAT